jgi:hypothetical protein
MPMFEGGDESHLMPPAKRLFPFFLLLKNGMCDFMFCEASKTIVDGSYRAGLVLVIGTYTLTLFAIPSWSPARYARASQPSRSKFSRVTPTKKANQQRTSQILKKNVKNLVRDEMKRGQADAAFSLLSFPFSLTVQNNFLPYTIPKMNGFAAKASKKE